MTLADLIQQPISYETAKDLSLVFSPELAVQLADIQEQHGNPRHVASPVDLVDGRKMLCADLLTEVGPGGMYATGFGFLPTELFPLVEVILMADASALLPKPEPDEI
jgi:hypothetical protein